MLGEDLLTRQSLAPRSGTSGADMNGFPRPHERRRFIVEVMDTTMTDTLINDKRKAELLANEVEHIDIKSFDARPIVDAMKKMSFSSRDTGRATQT